MSTDIRTKHLGMEIVIRYGITSGDFRAEVKSVRMYDRLVGRKYIFYLYLRPSTRKYEVIFTDSGTIHSPDETMKFIPRDEPQYPSKLEEAVVRFVNSQECRYVCIKRLRLEASRIEGALRFFRMPQKTIAEPVHSAL